MNVTALRKPPADDPYAPKSQAVKCSYRRAFPNGPQPLATFDMSAPEGVEAAKKAIGIDALKKAFGPGGKGIEDIIDNIRAAGIQTEDKT